MPALPGQVVKRMKGPWRKVYRSILDSWLSRDPDLFAFAIQLLLVCDWDGIIRIDYFEIAQRLGRAPEDVFAKVQELCRPRSESKSKQCGGAYLVQVGVGAWKIVNFLKYQNNAKAEARKAYKTRKMREYRARDRRAKISPKAPVDTGGQSVDNGVDNLPGKVWTPVDIGGQSVDNIEKEIRDIREEEEGASPPAPPKGKGLLTSEWLAQLANGPAYSGIDVLNQFGKYCEWVRVKKRVTTQEGFLRWLNRIETPIPGEEQYQNGSEPDEDNGWPEEYLAMRDTLFPDHGEWPEKFRSLPVSMRRMFITAKI